MQLIPYLLASLVAYSGLFAGVALAFIAPEELKPFRKYLSILLWKKKLLRYNHFAYVVFAFVFFFSRLNVEAFLLFSSIIFLYGLPTGTLMARLKEKKGTILSLLSFSHFVMSALLIYLLQFT